ncbi:MAG: DsrE family protein [Candidatus Rokubacteria bacterium]|nr:DsrE family protein [Candidatus Rokubacteria bacterium]
MADYMLYVGSYGMEDSYRAALVFAAAIAARGKKYEAKVALLGDGVLLMKDDIAKHTKPQGRDRIDKLIKDALKEGVTIHC